MFRQKWKAFSIVEYQQTVQILVVYTIIPNTLLVIGQNKHIINNTNVLLFFNFHLLVFQTLTSKMCTESFPKGRKAVSEVNLLRCVRLFVIPWTVAYQAPPSMGFSRQGYWSGLPFPSPGDLPDPGIKPRSPALQADALPSVPPGKPLLIYK